MQNPTVQCTWTYPQFQQAQMLRLSYFKPQFLSNIPVNFQRATAASPARGSSNYPPSLVAAMSTAATPQKEASLNGDGPAQKTQHPVQVAKRLEKFKTTIFTQMSQLAIKHGAINLGQGFPNFDGPEFVKAAAIQAINDGKNQYARGYGVPDLNAAVAERFQKDTGLVVDPEKEVTVTSGCTEAIAATMLGLINPQGRS